MGPCLEGGSEWCHNGFRRIQNQGPIPGHHMSYGLRASQVSGGSRAAVGSAEGAKGAPSDINSAIRSESKVFLHETGQDQP